MSCDGCCQARPPPSPLWFRSFLDVAPSLVRGFCFADRSSKLSERAAAESQATPWCDLQPLWSPCFARLINVLSAPPLPPSTTTQPSAAAPGPDQLQRRMSKIDDPGMWGRHSPSDKNSGCHTLELDECLRVLCVSADKNCFLWLWRICFCFCR